MIGATRRTTGQFSARPPSTPEARLARAVQTLQDRLVVDPLKKTTVIRVTYTSRDAESGPGLQTLATLYQEKHAAVHRPAGTFQILRAGRPTIVTNWQRPKRS